VFRHLSFEAGGGTFNEPHAKRDPFDARVFDTRVRGEPSFAPAPWFSLHCPRPTAVNINPVATPRTPSEH